MGKFTFKRTAIQTLAVVTVFQSSCGSKSSSEESSLSEAASSSIKTSEQLCNLSQNGTQQLTYKQVNMRTNSSSSVDESLNFNYQWSCTETSRSVSGNGVPNHSVSSGKFASRITAQTVTRSFPRAPEKTENATELREPGVALNSVKFEPGTAGTCPDSAENDQACDYGAGSDTWRMVALPGNTSPWNFDFGVDQSNGHVQPTGAYHYHGMPEELMVKLNGSVNPKITLVGWAADGFPIYARYGYVRATDASSEVKIIKSSYQIKDVPDSSRPSKELIPMGHFEQDWEYIEGSGDLDACNGRLGVTPEFPGGIYHYYITDTYPFIQRCVMGTATENTRPPPGNTQGKPPPS